jgi:hypothetical protein
METMSFNEWRKSFSRALNRKFGISINKIPDFPLESWWKDGLSVDNAISIVKDELTNFEDHPYDLR